MTVLAAVTISPGEFLAIVGATAIAAAIATVVKFGDVVIPVVVLELVAGVVIGPKVLGLHLTPFISFFSSIGLGMLFFFAGYEIDIRRISGAPMRLALLGWAVSLAIAYTVGGVLAAAGVVLSLLYTGSALATTAIGTLIPILSDGGLLEGRLGTYLLAAGAVGEFGPVMLLTLVLSAEDTLHNALILLAFMAVVVAVGVLTLRSSRLTLPLLERTLESSSQLAIRWVLVLVFALAFLAYQLGLELLLGAFAAGVIARQLLAGHELPAFDSKLSAIAFGVFVPFFFVVSGMKLDVSALFNSAGGVAKLVLFLGLFLVVRGAPAVLLYRQVLAGRERAALAFFSSTQLPMVVAITSLATADGHMRPSTAAALVGAAALSTLLFPILGLRAARRETAPLTEVTPVQPGESTAAGA